ncbi:ABC transporter substrate-binding protein [Desulfosporosinus hippei]|uniref:Putative ABC transport system substrate-binding protein n=1 Tax=Desulfosporosinus hippei DSM 8344 TaxID=1121419 RepID=A0A1G7TQB4_9FIRM|nr:ABC transporter substrate-binding protein [Desulfosporosinus hippei]SDG37411.1 putative ABC transport system substrate-binding protein [Desulfosporosinus hippei DSM 8344]
MKRKLAKMMISVLMTMTLVLSLTACSPSKTETPDKSVAKKNIGIVQIVEHPSLNTIKESIVTQLSEKGFKDGENISIDYQNAQGDQSTLKTIVTKFVNNKYDLIIAIATPSVQAAVSQTKDIPILFAACADPLGSGVVSNLEKPGGNVTGTSNAVSAEKILELAKRITPNFKTIGALYNSSETNSLIVIKGLKEYANKNNLTIVESTVTSSADVQQAATSLVEKVDVIFLPIDNTVATAMPLVAQIANNAKIPVYVGADSLVKDGGLATYGIDYSVLGKETADMGVEILNGKNPGDIPVRTMSDMKIYLNKDTATTIGVNFPEDVVKEAAQVFSK